MPESVRVGPSLAERTEVADYVADLIREHYRDGSCDVRVIFSDVPPADWLAVEGRIVHRFPAGEVKVETLGIGISVEWERRPS